MASLGQIQDDVEANASTSSGGGVTVLPDDVYELEVIESDVKANGKGTGLNLNFKVRVVAGPRKDVWFFDGINNIQHESAQSQTIAQGQLRALAEACGLDWPLTNTDSEVFHFRNFHAQVGSETYHSTKHNKELTKNKIVKYLYGDIQPDEVAPKPPVEKAATTQQQAPAEAGKRTWQRKAA